LEKLDELLTLNLKLEIIRVTIKLNGLQGIKIKMSKSNSRLNCTLFIETGLLVTAPRTEILEDTIISSRLRISTKI
jgi:hypothetical protein